MLKISKSKVQSKFVLDSSSDFINQLDVYETSQKRIFLFMIGGSGTSIIEPLLYYFSELFKQAKYKIIPIIIDRNFNSEIVSRNIKRIKDYQNVCAYSASDSIILNPYLFIDNNSLFDGDNNLGLIVKEITNSDSVAFSYSIYNKDNIRIKKTLVDNIRQKNNVRIFDLIFSKYFNLDFDGEEQDFKHDEIIENLEMSQDLVSHEYCFIAGNSTLRIPVDTRSLIPVISVHSVSNLQYRRQS